MITFRRRRRTHVVRILRAAAFGAPALVAASLLSPAAAADLSWDPGMTGPAVSGGTNTWDTTSNFWWNGTVDTTWTDGNAATFGGTAGVVTLAAPRSATGLTFSTDGYTLTGSTLTLTSPASVSVGAAISATINSNVAGTDGLNVSGGGTLILNNNNTGLLSGTINVTGPNSVLAAGAGTTSAFGSGSINATGGVVLAGGNGAIIPNGITADGSGIILRGLVGVTAPAGGGTGAGDVVTYSGAISGSGPLTVSNATTNVAPTSFTTVVLTNSANNWSGATTVNYGMLVLGASNVLPATTIVNLQGGGTPSQLYVPNGKTQQVAEVTGNGAITLNGTLKLGDGNDFHLGAALVDAGATGLIEKLGTGKMSIDTESPNYKGQFKLTQGRVGLETNARFGDSSSTNILTMDGGTIVMGNIVTMNRPVVIAAGGGYFDSTSNGNVLSFSGGNISGSGTFTKLSKIRLRLLSDNPSFSGPVDISGIGETGTRGFLAVAATPSNQAFGDNSATNIVTIGQYGSLAAQPANNPTIPQKIVITGTDVQPSMITNENNGTTISLTGVISGSGTLLLDRRVTNLILSGANTFSGPIYVNGDTNSLQISADNNLGDASATNVLHLGDIAPGSGIQLRTNPAVLKLLGSMSGSHRITIGPSTGGGTVDTNGFDGAVGLVDSSSSGSKFLKNGSGTLGVQRLSLSPSTVTVNAGTLKLLPDDTSTGVSVVNSTVIAAGAKLDITNNHLIDHTTGVGTATGGVYDKLSGLIQSGRNGGGWGGSGIVTSQTDATTSNFTSIGIATAQQVKGLANPGDTAVWAGQTVTGSDALVMYTYGGDANLDGKLNVDDYGHIDSSIGIGLTGWFNGDFNYDGKVNVDDYGIIDFNIGIQGPAFFAGAGSSGEGGVTAVPEPASIPVIALASLAVLSPSRRRMRRIR